MQYLNANIGRIFFCFVSFNQISELNSMPINRSAVDRENIPIEPNKTNTIAADTSKQVAARDNVINGGKPL